MGRADSEAIEAAITRSDNDAALRLWHELDDGAARVEAVLEAAKRLASKHVPQHPNTP